MRPDRRTPGCTLGSGTRLLARVDMGIFPSSFIDDLKIRADIVRIVQEHTPLRRVGNSYKGLCPFHAEKTPSFHVNAERGFFHCFGCGVGGDVIKFLELKESLPFPDAVRQLAQRLGIEVPESEDVRGDGISSAEREALLKLHEIAAGWFREALAGPAGRRARDILTGRGITGETIDRLGLGYAPAARTGLRERLMGQGIPLPLIVKSGLAVERDGGEIVDRFRHRLIIPIHRESGSIVAFGGRAMEAGQQPKYLNSPETPIYTKSRTLYGLHATKGAVKRLGYAVLVEGYFDFAQVTQAGIAPVVASCGTSVTGQQARLLRRFARKVIISFDPDDAGQGAAARWCELLVSEGFQVNVVMLPASEDPDTFVRSKGGEAYAEKLRTSQPYLDYLLDRTASAHDLGTDRGRRDFLDGMLAVASRIPDAAVRDQFADRLAHRARILEEVVREEIRRAAATRQPRLDERAVSAVSRQVRPAEKGLIWWLINDTVSGLTALADVEAGDLDELTSGGILKIAKDLRDWPGERVPDALLERLSTWEAALVREVAAAPAAPAPLADCLRALRRLRYERERAALQHEIDRLQEAGIPVADRRIDALWAQKKELLHRIEALDT